MRYYDSAEAQQRLFDEITDLKAERDALRARLAEAMVIVRGVADGVVIHETPGLHGAARGHIVVYGPDALMDLAREIARRSEAEHAAQPSGDGGEAG